MSQFKSGGQPKWWRRFKRHMTAQDLIVGRKVLLRTTDDDGVEHYHIELVRGVEKTLDKPPVP